MATTKLNGSEQIKANSVTSGQVDSSILVAAGTNAATGNQPMGGFVHTGLGNGVNPGDSINLAQAQALLLGLSFLVTVDAMTTGAETFTIASGSVTTINGLAVDGITLDIGDRILVKNAPASTGVGTADSSNAGTDLPGNGVYTVTVATTNLTVVRDSTSATPLSGTTNPTGKAVFAAEGTANKGAGYIVIDPVDTTATFTYGTTNMQWGKFNAAGSGTVTTASVATANGFAGTVATASTTPAITLTTSVTGVLKGNGTAISAATSGTDYLAPTEIVPNETPTGSVNSSNTAFTLAHTPIQSSLMLFLNGELLEPGSGNDYTISGASVTMLFAPATNDKLRAYYWQ